MNDINIELLKKLAIENNLEIPKEWNHDSIQYMLLPYFFKDGSITSTQGLSYCTVTANGAVFSYDVNGLTRHIHVAVDAQNMHEAMVLIAIKVLTEQL